MPRDVASETRVSLVLVSHSAALATGLAEFVTQVAGPHVRIHPVGGDPHGGLGTDGPRVAAALRLTADTTGGVVLMDIGSSVLTVRAVLAELSPLQRDRIIAVDAPLVEGAIAAGVAAAIGGSTAEVARAAEGARSATKL